MSTCAVPGCGRPQHPCGRGALSSQYCTTHHMRVRRCGDAYAEIPIDQYRGETLAQRRKEMRADSQPTVPT